MDNRCQSWECLQHLLKGIGVNDLRPARARDIGVFSLGSKASPGDHIAIRRDEDVAWHHGIFAGSGFGDQGVIDMQRNGDVMLRSFDTFMGDQHRLAQAVIIDYDGEGDPDECRYRALCRALTVAMGPEFQQPVYSLLGANCETFATWCKLGRCDIVTVKCLVRVLASAPAPKQRGTKGDWFNTQVGSVRAGGGCRASGWGDACKSSGECL